MKKQKFSGALIEIEIVDQVKEQVETDHDNTETVANFKSRKHKQLKI